MKLTAKIRLLPTSIQAEQLLATLVRANAACNAISEYAFTNTVFKSFTLHKALYHSIKSDFDLSAQVVVRCLGKVGDAYKLDKAVQRRFRPTGAIAYDTRILSYSQAKKQVSIWTTGGRELIHYVGGMHNEGLLVYQKGESDLLYTKGKFFLLATCDIPDGDTHIPEDVLGVDLGIINLATDSDGQTFSGAGVEASRQWYGKRRAVLQSVGSKSAKRRLKKLSGKQARFQRDVNHCISKSLVLKAKGTFRALSIEDLSGISKNVRKEKKRLRQTQRAKHSNWSFFQLRSFLTYKSQFYGVSLTTVDPAYTSRTCNECGHCEKANRKSQAEFVCRACAHSDSADWNAAKNIRNIGRIQTAYGLGASVSGTSPRALAGGI